jgi:ribosomal protein S12 methylthiotransferase RimO
LKDKKLYLVSLGCTKNLVDSEVMLGRLKEYKLTDSASSANIIIVNTCGFINSAKEESINTILTLAQEKKRGSILVVSGCLSERYKEELKELLPEVDIFTGVGEYEKIDKIIEKRRGVFFSNSIYLADDNSPRLITGSNFHAYIKISEGCNQNCSFCAIPNFKGRLFSRTVESIEREVKALVKKGFFEFTFISQDSSSFGRDLGLRDGLIELIDRVEDIDGVKVARILYLYPSTTTFKLIDKIADSKVFQTYYDMPIQHISDNMLKVMKRGFGKQKTIELLRHMKSKDEAFIRSSIIVGHPEETEDDFNEVCAFLEDFNFDRVNIFEYSNEEDTQAFLMPQVDEEIISNRVAILEEIVEKTTLKSLKNMVGREYSSILEGVSDEHEYLYSARPFIFAKDIDGDIIINDTSNLDLEVGRVYRVEVTELISNRLIGTLKR